ncbi:hypothetical protein [Streptomyces sp. NBC_00566]|uniref:hypothetical protein n=1 Tax=Streptomyces sp. NBC_00566 TaxID=2975778 RepID=UPI002E8225B8|nr:hypothetical protein [Streptomyces sp. NBC_00566]WUB85164.1 hypothetical protein OG812_00400 [Streptomyces sp. NBC_00566]
MDAGDWIALAAVVISVGAAGISVHQAKTAKDSAAYAREQAAAAKEANQLTRQQMAHEDIREQQAAAEAGAAALREAEKVALGFHGNGGSVMVSITNNGAAPITEVELLEVRADQDGPWASWSVNRNIGGPLAQTKRSVLGQREVMEVATSPSRHRPPSHPSPTASSAVGAQL